MSNMEAENIGAVPGQVTAVNGRCSPTETIPVITCRKNIDDIATPSDLKFDEEFDFEDADIISKRKEIEKYLDNPDNVNLEQWQDLARSKGGLISDEYRRRIWPLLVGVTQEELTDPPSLEELSSHPEYNQVVLDVNRSLKRFPPGIPLERRLALQDQLTVLILRVIIAYPDLSYYQGYHDVAVTLLLVCGARAAFPLLARLSGGGGGEGGGGGGGGEGGPLRAFMQPTMSAAQHRLNFLVPALRRLRPDLADKMVAAGVGTMFALPWFLTWFGHSLPRYGHVVRLYDYFLSAPPLFPVYVTAALVAHRADDVLDCDDDMAAMHCLLSRLPDGLPWEDILSVAWRLAEQWPPAELEDDVRQLERREDDVRRRDEQRAARRRAARAAAAAATAAPQRRAAAARRYVLAAAAVLLGVWAYYHRPELLWPR